MEDLRQLIETVVVARALGLARPVPSHAALRPPVPELSEQQLKAAIARAKERPWSARPKYHMSAFEWVRDNFGESIPGLRQSHLKLADEQLYIAFSKRLSRANGRRPDWLDLPSDNEHHLRVVAFMIPFEPWSTNVRSIENECSTADGRANTGHQKNITRSEALLTLSSTEVRNVTMSIVRAHKLFSDAQRIGRMHSTPSFLSAGVAILAELFLLRHFIRLVAEPFRDCTSVRGGFKILREMDDARLLGVLMGALFLVAYTSEIVQPLISGLIR